MKTLTVLSDSPERTTDIITVTTALPHSATVITSDSRIAPSPRKSRTWWTDFILICVVLGLSESARGIVIPTISNYVTSLGGSAVYLSAVVSAFSVGRLVASFIFGWMSDYTSPRTLLIISTCGCIIGDTVYCIAGNVGWLWLLFASRLCTGFGTGMLSIARSYVSVTTANNERTLWMAWLGVIQFVGYAFTPIIGSIPVDWSIGEWKINSNTAASYGLLCFEVILCIFLYALMSDGHEQRQAVLTQQIPLTPEPVGQEQEQAHPSADNAEMNVVEVAAEERDSCSLILPISESDQVEVVTVMSSQPNWSIAVVFLYESYVWTVINWLPLLFVALNLVTRGVLSVVETFGTPLFNIASDPFDADPPPTQAGTFFLILGAIGTVIYLSMNFLTRCFREVDLLVFAITIMAFGFLYLIDFDNFTHWDASLAKYSVCMICIWSIGTPISQTLVVSMLSKRLGKSNAGLWMGIVTAAGSVGRILFPPIAGVIYQVAGQSWAVMFPALVCITAAVVTIYALDVYSMYVENFCYISTQVMNWIERWYYSARSNGPFVLVSSMSDDSLFLRNIRQNDENLASHSDDKSDQNDLTDISDDTQSHGTQTS